MTGSLQSENGTVVKGLGGLYEVALDGGQRVECRGRGVFRHEKLTILPGDRVSVLDDGKGRVIDRVFERRSLLIRPAFANLDVMYLLIPSASPAPSFITCDKLISVCEYNGVDVKIIVSKSDLACENSLEIENIYKKCGFDVIRHGKDFDAENVRRFVYSFSDGKISAFSGASGVGKSTLLNALFPSLALETGDVSRRSERGKHTTRKAELFDLETLTDGRISGFLADTPGFSMLDFERFDFFSRDSLFGTFREFVPFEGQCKFKKCTHTKEEGCAILASVNNGSIPKSRHDSYLELFSVLKNKHEWDKN